MQKVQIDIQCCLCRNKHTATIEVPQGWSPIYGTIDADGFCPDHQRVAEFRDSQCPGCVGGWQDCDLWRAFAYETKGLSEDDFAVIRRGVCPKRTGGTFGFNLSSGGPLESIDLSNAAPSEAGAALEAAIKDYWKCYAEYPEADKP